jgi:hypothetical protein
MALLVPAEMKPGGEGDAAGPVPFPVPFVGPTGSGAVALPELAGGVYCRVLVTVICEVRDESAAGAVAETLVAGGDKVDERTKGTSTDGAAGEVARTDVRLIDSSAYADVDTLTIVEAAVDEALGPVEALAG